MGADPAPLPTASSSLASRVSRVRHDLHNSIGHILGFSEMLREEAEKPGGAKIRVELELIRDLAGQLISQTNETLEAANIEAGRADLPGLRGKLDGGSARIIDAANKLARISRK